MSVTVTLLFDDGTPIDAGVQIDLLSAGAVAATEPTTPDGAVVFAVDPSTLVSPAVRLSGTQDPSRPA